MRESPVPRSSTAPERVGEVWRVPYGERARRGRAWAERARARHRPRTTLPHLPARRRRPEHLLHARASSSSSRVAPARRGRRQPAALRVPLPQPRRDHADRPHAGHAPARCRSSTRSGSSTTTGNHPPPYTLVSREDVESGRWRVNPAVAASTGIEAEYAQRQLAPVHAGARGGRQVRPDDLAVPRDARRDRPRSRLGGRGGRVLPRGRPLRQPDFQVKGENPLTEHYSMLGPEVNEGPDGEPMAERERRADRAAARRSTRSSSPARRRATASPGRSTTCSTVTTSASAARAADVTCSRTALRRSSCPASSTTRTRRTPPSAASPTRACTSSARPSRLRAWPGIGEQTPACQVTSSSRGFGR